MKGHLQCNRTDGFSRSDIGGGYAIHTTPKGFDREGSYQVCLHRVACWLKEVWPQSDERSVAGPIEQGW